MRHAAVLVLVVLVVAGCYTQPRKSGSDVPPWFASVPDTSQSPCRDSLYLELSRRPLDGLSDREYDYIRRHDEACSEWKRQYLMAREAARNTEMRRGAIGAVVAVGFMGAVVTAAMLAQP